MVEGLGQYSASPSDPRSARATSPSRGGLANAFLCTANIDAADGGARIVEGNRKVLAARLSDARFFYEQDLKLPLEEQAKKLDRIVFHEKLGTVADKVDRVAKLARWLVEEGIVGKFPSRSWEGLGVGLSADTGHGETPFPSLSRKREGSAELADLAERAARLCKADLVTGMVGEFPELQGLIGGHIARAQGEHPAVADAVRDHYKPVGQGDEVPTAPVTVAVSLADKLDTLIGFFDIGEKPTGSRDPFALRRAALGVVALIVENGLRLELNEDLKTAVGRRQGFTTAFYHGRSDLIDFFADRLKVQQREAGVRHDLIDAVFALGGEDDLVRLLARVRALQAFVETPEGADLLTGYKRAANILKREGWGSTPSPSRGEGQRSEAPQGEGTDSPSPSAADAAFPSPLQGEEQNGNKSLPYEPEIEETALVAALDSAEPRAHAAVEAEDFEGAMAALAGLRAPVDSFFEKVTVNDPDPAKREARLALLARMRDAVHRVADFSRIEG